MKDDPRWHPIANLFPLGSEDELQHLADDIDANTLLNPVVMYQEKVLDGRRRVRACELAGIPWEKIEKIEAPEVAKRDPIRWVCSQNLERRHLTSSQMAAV